MEKMFGLTFGDTTVVGATSPWAVFRSGANVFRINGHAGEGVRGLVADVAVIEPGGGGRPEVDAGVDQDQAAGIGVRKGPQQHVLRHGEHGGIGADGQRQGDHRQSGKTGRETELADRLAQILKQTGHR
jgi:hypothetical protein